ncbi:NUDIX hydrolase [Thermaerobacter litoralis]
MAEPGTTGPVPPAEVECLTLHGQRRRYPAHQVRFRPAVYGVAVDGGRVLLGRSAFTGRLDIPGGAVEPWESLEQALRREFREETGVEPEPIELFHFTENFFAFFNHPFHSLRFYYLVRVPAGATFTPQLAEVTEIGWVDLATAPADAFAPGDREILHKAVERAAARA